MLTDRELPPQPERQPAKWGIDLAVPCSDLTSEPVTLHIRPRDDDEQAAILARESAERGRAIADQINEQGFAVLKGESEPTEAQIEAWAHEIWASALTAPGEGIADAIGRIAGVLRAALAAKE